MTQEGRATTGQISAPSEPSAVTILAQRGDFVTDIQQITQSASSKTDSQHTKLQRLFRGRGKGRHVAAMFRQLAVALQAGLNVITALQVVRDQTSNAAMDELVSDLIERVQAGDALSQAMRRHRDTFSLMQIAMIKAGEAAGVLEKVMSSLADFAERDLDIREKLRSASIYPLVVLCLGFISVLVILIFILPRIMATITQVGGNQTLPLPTRLLLGASAAVRSPAGIATSLILLVGLIMLIRWMRSDDGRPHVDRFKLRLPIAGEAFRRVAMARFARTLGTLTGSGIQVVEAMRIVRDTLGNEYLARIVDRATTDIVHGRAITEPLAESGEFPELLVQVIAMGERTGQLDTLLLTTASAYDREVETTLQRVMSVLPVLFILALAVVVAFILAAALLPIVYMDFGV